MSPVFEIVFAAVANGGFLLTKTSGAEGALVMDVIGRYRVTVYG